MLKYGTSEIGKRNYKVYIKTATTPCTSLSDTAGVITGAVGRRLGACSEQPKFTTDSGEVINLESGSKKNLSQVANFEATLLQVTEENKTELDKIINTQIDIFFTDAVSLTNISFDASGLPTGLTEVGKQVIMIRGQYGFPALNIVGNDRNSITISSSKDTSATIGTSDIIFIEGSA